MQLAKDIIAIITAPWIIIPIAIGITIVLMFRVFKG